jgi:hypothetical protein
VPGEKPLFWKLFDAAEGAVGPRLEEAVRTGTFAEALGLATRAQAAARHSLEKRSRRVWHLVNLPAGSDVTRLRRQVALLDGEVRRLSEALERALEEQRRREEGDGADASRRPAPPEPARARGAAGPRAPRRRAQRAPGP